MKTINGVKSNVDVWEWGALDSKCRNCVVNSFGFIHFNCTWTFLRETYFLFLVSTGIGCVFVCTCRKDLAHFGCVCALFVFVCEFRNNLAHFRFMCALFVFVCAFRKDLAHFGFVCALFVFVCAFRKDLVHFGAEASIIRLCQTWQKCLRLLCFRTGFSTKSIFCFGTSFLQK